MKTFLIVSLLIASAFAAPNSLGNGADEEKSLPDVNREKKSPSFGIQKVKIVSHAAPQHGHFAAPPIFKNLYRENKDSSEEDVSKQCKIKESKNTEQCKEMSAQNEDDVQINLVEDQLKHSINKAMNTIMKLKTKLEQMQGEIEAKQIVPVITETTENIVQDLQPSQDKQPQLEIEPAKELLAIDESQGAEIKPAAEQQQVPSQAQVSEEPKTENVTVPTKEITARSQWKDAEDEEDSIMMSNIATAKQALDDAQKMFNDMLSMNREAHPESENSHKLEKMSETERMAQWKDAIENIERNVEIAQDIKRSFMRDMDDEAMPAASDLKVHVMRPETMLTHAQEKSVEEMENEGIMRNTNLLDAEAMSPLNTDESSFARGHEQMHPHHLHHHHHQHHLRQPESESLMSQNLAQNDNDQIPISNMRMLQQGQGMQRQREMFHMNPAMRASQMFDASRMDSEMQANNMEREDAGQIQHEQMRFPLSRNMQWRPMSASDAPRSAYGPSLSLNIGGPSAPALIRRPILAARPNFALGAPSYSAPVVSANSNFAGANSFVTGEEAGTGESVGLFPTSPGGCSVPLLLSCSPNVVQGSLAHHASAPIALQAPHSAPAAYGPQAVAVNSGAGLAYRDGDASLHSKRDVTADARDAHTPADVRVPDAKTRPDTKENQ